MEQAPHKADSYLSLRAVNVNDFIEKKNGLSYLSWAFAVDQLLQRDPAATWEYRFGTELIGEHHVQVPYIRIGGTAMVFCTVKAFGVERTAQLPVMDHKNKAIPDPDAFQVNTAMQRALAKAIALHGLGLYIYAGEDVPPEEEKPEPPKPKVTAEELAEAKKVLADAETRDELKLVYQALNEPLREATKEYVVALSKKLKVAA